MRIKEYELGFNNHRIWAKIHERNGKNVNCPIKSLYRTPIETITMLFRVLCKKTPW